MWGIFNWLFGRDQSTNEAVVVQDILTVTPNSDRRGYKKEEREFWRAAFGFIESYQVGQSHLLQDFQRESEEAYRKREKITWSNIRGLGVSKPGYGGYEEALENMRSFLEQLSHVSSNNPREWNALKLNATAVVSCRKADLEKHQHFIDHRYRNHEAILNEWKEIVAIF